MDNSFYCRENADLTWRVSLRMKVSAPTLGVHHGAVLSDAIYPRHCLNGTLGPKLIFHTEIKYVVNNVILTIKGRSILTPFQMFKVFTVPSSQLGN